MPLVGVGGYWWVMVNAVGSRKLFVGLGGFLGSRRLMVSLVSC